MAYRVVQWTTGNVGVQSVKAIVSRSDLELVGCYAWSPEEVGREVGVVQLKDPLRFQQITESMLAQIAKVCTGGKVTTDQLLDRLTEEDLSPMCRGQQAGQAVERRSRVITGRVGGGLRAVPGRRLALEGSLRGR